MPASDVLLRQEDIEKYSKGMLMAEYELSCGLAFGPRLPEVHDVLVQIAVFNVQLLRNELHRRIPPDNVD